MAIIGTKIVVGLLGKCALPTINHALIPDPPEVAIELGSKLNAVDIREGDDVYFECTIDAFPEAERIAWKKDVSNIVVLKYVKGQECIGFILFAKSLLCWKRS